MATDKPLELSEEQWALANDAPALVALLLAPAPPSAAATATSTTAAARPIATRALAALWLSDLTRQDPAAAAKAGAVDPCARLAAEAAAGAGGNSNGDPAVAAAALTALASFARASPQLREAVVAARPSVLSTLGALLGGSTSHLENDEGGRNMATEAAATATTAAACSLLFELALAPDTRPRVHRALSGWPGGVGPLVGVVLGGRCPGARYATAAINALIGGPTAGPEELAALAAAAAGNGSSSKGKPAAAAADAGASGPERAATEALQRAFISAGAIRALAHLATHPNAGVSARAPALAALARLMRDRGGEGAVKDEFERSGAPAAMVAALERADGPPALRRDAALALYAWLAPAAPPDGSGGGGTVGGASAGQLSSNPSSAAASRAPSAGRGGAKKSTGNKKGVPAGPAGADDPIKSLLSGARATAAWPGGAGSGGALAATLARARLLAGLGAVRPLAFLCSGRPYVAPRPPPQQQRQQQHALTAQGVEGALDVDGAPPLAAAPAEPVAEASHEGEGADDNASEGGNATSQQQQQQQQQVSSGGGGRAKTAKKRSKKGGAAAAAAALDPADAAARAAAAALLGLLALDGAQRGAALACGAPAALAGLINGGAAASAAALPASARWGASQAALLLSVPPAAAASAADSDGATDGPTDGGGSGIGGGASGPSAALRPLPARLTGANLPSSHFERYAPITLEPLPALPPMPPLQQAAPHAATRAAAAAASMGPAGRRISGHAGGALMAGGGGGAHRASARGSEAGGGGGSTLRGSGGGSANALGAHVQL